MTDGSQWDGSIFEIFFFPKEFFQAQLVPTSYWRKIYVPLPDGQRILMVTPTGKTKPEPVTVAINWPGLLKGGGV